MTNLSIDQLIGSLESIPPLELQAIDLLKTLRPQTGEWFPTNLPPDVKPQVVEATIELVDYTRRCANMVRLLSHLQPIPMTDILVDEFVL